MSIKRFIYNWSHQVNSLWCGNTGCTKFVLKVPFDYKTPMIITGYNISKYGYVEVYGQFVPEKESKQYNRNGDSEGNEGLRYFE